MMQNFLMTLCFVVILIASNLILLRTALGIIQKSIMLRLVVAKKSQLIGGDADEFLRLEGEIRAYERILKEGPASPR